MTSPDTPAVSIGLPFYNCADTLELAIRSIFAQTFQDWELILLDDGSNDSSLVTAQQVKDPRVRVIHDGSNVGLTARLNELTRESRGEVIARMDADDVMVPDRLERQVAVLRKRPDVDVVVSPSYLIDRESSVYGIDSRAPLHSDASMFLRPYGGWFAHPTMTARRAWMEKYPYDEGYRVGQERELFCRTYDESTFYKLTEPTLLYREAGTVRLATYRAQRRVERRILRIYGPELIGRRASVAISALTGLKEAVYVCAAHAGRLGDFDRKISGRRADPLSEQEFDDARSALQRAHRTHVAGLPTPA